jgi:hypothetical protein
MLMEQGVGYILHVHTAGCGNTPCTVHISTAGGGEEGNVLLVHNAGVVDGYTLRVHTAGRAGG